MWGGGKREGHSGAYEYAEHGIMEICQGCVDMIRLKRNTCYDMNCIFVNCYLLVVTIRDEIVRKVLVTYRECRDEYATGYVSLEMKEGCKEL